MGLETAVRVMIHIMLLGNSVADNLFMGAFTSQATAQASADGFNEHVIPKFQPPDPGAFAYVVEIDPKEGTQGALLARRSKPMEVGE